MPDLNASSTSGPDAIDDTALAGVGSSRLEARAGVGDESQVRSTGGDRYDRIQSALARPRTSASVDTAPVHPPHAHRKGIGLLVGGLVTLNLVILAGAAALFMLDRGDQLVPDGTTENVADPTPAIIDSSENVVTGEG